MAPLLPSPSVTMVTINWWGGPDYIFLHLIIYFSHLYLIHIDPNYSCCSVAFISPLNVVMNTFVN